MDWQDSADNLPSGFITDEQVRSVAGKPPVTGAWRDGDAPGNRQFANLGPFDFECGGSLPHVRIAYETWGTLNEAKDNAVLVLHALTGDSHVVGPAGGGHTTAGWWNEVVGPGLAIDTDKWFVVAPNVLGGCQGSTGPASLAPDGYEWGSRFPYTTIRDQARAQAQFSDVIGIEKWAAVIGGSMGGMHALEWGAMFPERVERLAVLAAPPATSADEIALNTVQIEAIMLDPAFRAGHYYEARDGEGPFRGLALARRISFQNFRTPSELNERFDRSSQSDISPLGKGGRFAVASYLDFHGNKFTRRFDANSYITLVEAMNSHDLGRNRESIESVLESITIPTLIIGIDSDRFFPLAGQKRLAAHIPGNINGDEPALLESDFGHDAFLIESEFVGAQISRLLAS
ncbi:homoserine O-acetyltransferase MetX [Aurantimicrobium minutum]|jgi:homoserine O-acetyltransferase|uniref:homoserine O-acetyltransferase MetX n=1 Tax=Aurantimicrobium minutum TaxID=708131 RepID=UPI002475B4F3|nr:homoserine O-acetyltransferase [Aurantimicrobium minutum]MDH6256058.1 homoserine O-acetyltransferase [Aurantimicrobium minutum]